MIVKSCRDIPVFNFFTIFVMNFWDFASLIRIMNYFINYFPSTFHVTVVIFNLRTVVLLNGRLN